jgi:hypothetical protein
VLELSKCRIEFLVGRVRPGWGDERPLAPTREVRRVALMSTAAHPGYTRTNLQTAGASLGRGRPSRLHALMNRIDFLPSQGVEQGAEPLLYAATSPEAVAGGHYGPGGRFGLVGPTAIVHPPRRALNAATNARLWTAAQRLIGAGLPAAVA